ncbi:profilin, required for normal timing of actin polymerization in response to thermal stress, partial [Marasmius tenuissimus]
VAYLVPPPPPPATLNFPVPSIAHYLIFFHEHNPSNNLGTKPKPCNARRQLSTEEQKAIITGFQNPSSVLSGGLKLAGQKYFAINADDKTIQLKKQGDGAVLVKTTQAVLVAAYVAPIQQPEAATVAEGLGDYLRGVGY